MDSLGADNNKKNKTKSEDFSSVIYAAFHGLPNKPSKTGRRTSAPSTTFNSSEIILTEKSRSITPTPSTSGYNHHGGGDSTTATPRNGTRPH
ncbi:hypothetical protein BCR41DRAFT_344355 [Lobosporangium transversale]|uniref:Uncharacterized protein n=1 Tax=Lobosporangium transversale TaxID=64571 RepID=A0A1Y2H315_9FUNG|nr:hypothetical protein BCR41DRAFT_344355 [Lobosporangium transversale]ORZ28969.1 hypothetical protein BCR41DRAFT_344355 [Lobosporangium transversale]|eukprot:XP_021886642.1 hypothetical protein BCR41DRAFT_344355 [Lobosporangium transversale]